MDSTDQQQWYQVMARGGEVEVSMCYDYGILSPVLNSVIHPIEYSSWVNKYKFSITSYLRGSLRFRLPST